MHVRQKKQKSEQIEIFKDFDLNRNVLSKKEISIKETNKAEPGEQEHNRFITRKAQMVKRITKEVNKSGVRAKKVEPRTCVRTDYGKILLGI